MEMGHIETVLPTTGWNHYRPQTPLLRVISMDGDQALLARIVHLRKPHHRGVHAGRRDALGCRLPGAESLNGAPVLLAIRSKVATL